jgi:glucose/mannose-6-phosphate isomerase
MAHLNVNLDEAGLLLKADPFGMMALTLDLPAQCEEAIRRAEQWNLPALKARPGNILVTGLGGSGIGGDYLRVLFEAQGNLPVIVNRDYTLPAFVNSETLVFAVSYSGNTEETLASYAHARESGAQVMTVSSGGELEANAHRDGVPHLKVPGGQPPRTALGYLFMPLAVMCERWGLLPNLSEARTHTLRRLVQRRELWGPNNPTSNNPAKQLATALYGQIPLFYGTGGYRAIVATRWKGQFNENAKVHAFANTFPELNHNEILGWVLAKQQADNLSVIALRTHEESVKIQTRVRVTRQLVGESAQWHEVYAEGTTVLEQLMDLTFLGDFVSLYLSFLNGVDPQNIDYINHLKSELSRM